MDSTEKQPPQQLKLSTVELKFLLKLLGCEDYCAPLVSLKPRPKIARGELLAIAQSLQAQELIEYSSQVERFAITQRGRALFKVELAARPVTPDEWRVLQSCRKGAIEVELITAKVPVGARQALLQNLEQGEFIKVLRRGAADVCLTSMGEAFLQQYRPQGHQAVLSLDLLTNYLNFMATSREAISQARLHDGTDGAEGEPKLWSVA